MNLNEIGVIAIPLVVAQRQQITMPGNWRQKVLEIMGHATRQLTNCLHFLTLHELHLEVFELRHVIQDGNNVWCFGLSCEVQRHLQKSFFGLIHGFQELRRCPPFR